MGHTPNRRRDRHDASRVQLPYDFNGIFPYIMKGRNDSVAYYPLTIDAEYLEAYIEAKRGTPQEITFFQAVLLALVKILRRRPTLNRYIVGRRLYQRRDVVLSFIARRQYSDDSSETNVMVIIPPGDDPATVRRKVTHQIDQARRGGSKADDRLISLFLHLPRGLLRLAVRLFEVWDFYVDTPGFLRGVDPLRCSAYVANLGSVGLGAPYHHLYEWGNCGVFVCIGQIQPRVTVGPDGQPTVRRMVDLRITLDERIADGYYDARSLDLFTRYLTNPELLERP